jgi:O-antigen biosynthesis protein
MAGCFKTDLRRYSDNIICADLTLPALLDGVRKLTTLAKDPQACVANLEADNINHDWEKALADVIAQLPEFLEKRHHNVS